MKCGVGTLLKNANNLDFYDHGISGVTFFRGGVAFTVATNGEGSGCSRLLQA